MGNAPNNENNKIVLAKSYGINPEQIIIIKGKTYLKQDRPDHKLTSSILKAFKNGNNFSRDHDEEEKPK